MESVEAYLVTEIPGREHPMIEAVTVEANMGNGYFKVRPHDGGHPFNVDVSRLFDSAVMVRNEVDHVVHEA